MFGFVKGAAMGAVLSCGAVMAYELPTRNGEVPVPASVGTEVRIAAPSRPIRARSRLAAQGFDRSSCKPMRRKLWVEGEGWIVKSIARC
jgi:hypothetical protein